MRRLLQFLLLKPVAWLVNRFSPNPDKDRVFHSLDGLLNQIEEKPGDKGLILNLDQVLHRKFIVFSDLHKGTKNGADDFAGCEFNYLQALDYYYKEGFCLVGLGDYEELWENKILGVRKHNQDTILSEKRFIHTGNFIKIVGNHDIYWKNDPFAPMILKWIYDFNLKVYEGLLLVKSIKGKQRKIFLAHGHQGDGQSDGNPFSAWFVSNIWAPFQAYLRINPNTPAYIDSLKTIHNHIMYEWSVRQQDLLLITGHTHQPVFESMTHLERLFTKLVVARKEGAKEMIIDLENQIEKIKIDYKEISEDYANLKPTYFNSGCCCFSDGDITGIELDSDVIRLIKWSRKSGGRLILEERKLEELFD